jgi:hypothetical protein
MCVVDVAEPFRALWEEVGRVIDEQALPGDDDVALSLTRWHTCSETARANDDSNLLCR